MPRRIDRLEWLGREELRQEIPQLSPLRGGEAAQQVLLVRASMDLVQEAAELTPDLDITAVVGLFGARPSQPPQVASSR